MTMPATDDMADVPYGEDPLGRVKLTLWKVINNIADKRSAKEKQKLLASAWNGWDDEHRRLLEETLKYTYDSSIRFGISMNNVAQPTTRARSPKEFGSWVFVLLDQVMAESSIDGKRALLEAELGNMSDEGRELLSRIVSKDMRAGFGETIINKVFPTLLSKFDVMLAKPFAARHVDSWPVLVEPKLDGLRVIAIADTSARSVEFYTRSGKSISSLDKLKTEVLAFAQQFCEGDKDRTVAFDGEVTSGSFLESLSSVRKSSEQMKEGTYHVFDVLTRAPGLSPIALTDVDLQEQGTQLQRRQRLQAGFTALKKHIPKPEFVTITSSYTAGSEDEVFTLYNACRDAGLEGVIVKDPTAFYVKKRSISWMKIKAEETIDLPVIGAFEGMGKYAGSLGGLIVSHKGVSVNVGSGFSDDQRHEYWQAMKEDQIHVERGERSKCQLIDCPIEVQYQEIMPSGSLRHPVFVRLRRDKMMGMVGAF